MKLQQEMQQKQQGMQQAQLQAQANKSVMSNNALPNGAQTGESVAPGFPEGATAYSRNGNRPPQTGVPPWFGTERQGAGNGSNLDMSYVAKRAAAIIQGLPQDRQQQTLQNMAQSNPPLHEMVVNILSSRQGDQSDPLNPTTNPISQQRPSRADAGRKVGF